MSEGVLGCALIYIFYFHCKLLSYFLFHLLFQLLLFWNYIYIYIIINFIYIIIYIYIYIYIDAYKTLFPFNFLFLYYFFISFLPKCFSGSFIVKLSQSTWSCTEQQVQCMLFPQQQKVRQMTHIYDFFVLIFFISNLIPQKVFRCVALTLATCAWKPKVPRLYLAASYVKGELYVVISQLMSNRL